MRFIVASRCRPPSPLQREFQQLSGQEERWAGLGRRLWTSPGQRAKTGSGSHIGRGTSMADFDGTTQQVERWIQLQRQGDRGARDALLACVGDRLLKLTRKMLRLSADV